VDVRIHDVSAAGHGVLRPGERVGSVRRDRHACSNMLHVARVVKANVSLEDGEFTVPTLAELRGRLEQRDAQRGLQVASPPFASRQGSNL